MLKKILRKINRIYTLTEGKKQVKKAYVDTGKMTQDEFVELLDKDPSDTNKYIDWMARMYVKSGIKNIEAYDIIDDFDELSQNNRLAVGERDINKYDSLEALNAVVLKYIDVESKTQYKKRISAEDAETVFENDKVIIIKPKTVRSSCKYGSGAKWCTAATKDANLFKDYYVDRMATLYYIIPKKRVRRNYRKIAIEVTDSGYKRAWTTNGKETPYRKIQPFLEKLGVPFDD